MSGTYKHTNVHQERDVGDLTRYPGSGITAIKPRIIRALKQFMKYSIVGASGFVINMAVYSFMVKAVGLHYMAAAVVSFTAAVTSNFILNKYWTFSNPQGAVSRQARRFLIVSIASLIPNLLILRVLMEIMVSSNALGVDRAIVSQAIAITICTVLNFSGNKLWSFRQPSTP
jgi:dolichol-phosphate mannosyltransferase